MSEEKALEILVDGEAVRRAMLIDAVSYIVAYNPDGAKKLLAFAPRIINKIFQ